MPQNSGYFASHAETKTFILETSKCLCVTMNLEQSISQFLVRTIGTASLWKYCLLTLLRCQTGIGLYMSYALRPRSIQIQPWKASGKKQQNPSVERQCENYAQAFWKVSPMPAVTKWSLISRNSDLFPNNPMLTLLAVSPSLSKALVSPSHLFHILLP